MPILRFFILCASVVLATAVTATESPFLRHALEGFDAWDTDNDKSLTVREIEYAIASPDVKQEKAAAVVALRRVARSRSNPVRAFTKDDIRRMSGMVVVDDSADVSYDREESADNDARPAGFDKFYAAALKRIQSTPRELIVGGVPKLDDFKQGRLGSCFCLAPLTALVYADPKEAAKMFKPSPDGETVTVTFGKNNPVKVTRITDGEIALATGTGNNGVWAATFEKAVGQMRAASRASENSPTPLSIVSRGGSAGSMLSVLTGNTIERFSCRPWFEDSATPKAELEEKLRELRSLMKSATLEKRLMTAGTPSKKNLKVPSLSRGHAYAVLGYDARSDLVTFRDPHGQNFTPRGTPGLKNGYVIKQGIFRAPLPEVVQFMGGFAFEQKTPLKTKGYVEYAPSSAND